MSKFFALVCTGAVHAASVAVREHVASADPHALLENLRALAKEAETKKIDGTTLAAVAGLVEEMQTQVNASLAQCAQAEDNLCFATRQRLTEINTQLGQDVEAVAGETASIVDTVSGAINQGRYSESVSHQSRNTSCEGVCNSLTFNPPCTPPALPEGCTEYPCGWLADDEPCCDRAVDADLVPDTPQRQSQWKDLEDYMRCLDTWMEDPTSDYFSAYTDYQQWAGDCVNASETWESQKELMDPQNSNVARDMCVMIDNDVNKCTKFHLDWSSAMNLHNSQIEASEVIIENGLQQYEAMRKIVCLFEAISSGLPGDEIRTACDACEAMAANCGPWCPADGEFGECPVGLRSPTCCLPEPTPNHCESRHKCDVCTDAFRGEFYGCPAEGCSDSPDLNDLINAQADSVMCSLLIQQMSCRAGFSCEAECQGLDEGCGAGYICDPNVDGGKRVSYNEFICAVEGNQNF